MIKGPGELLREVGRSIVAFLIVVAMLVLSKISWTWKYLKEKYQ